MFKLHEYLMHKLGNKLWIIIMYNISITSNKWTVSISLAAKGLLVAGKFKLLLFYYKYFNDS